MANTSERPRLREEVGSEGVGDSWVKETKMQQSQLLSLRFLYVNPTDYKTEDDSEMVENTRILCQLEKDSRHYTHTLRFWGFLFCFVLISHSQKFG